MACRLLWRRKEYSRTWLRLRLRQSWGCCSKWLLLACSLRMLVGSAVMDTTLCLTRPSSTSTIELKLLMVQRTRSSVSKKPFMEHQDSRMFPLELLLRTSFKIKTESMFFSKKRIMYVLLLLGYMRSNKTIAIVLTR